jgi:hypothetical protein
MYVGACCCLRHMKAWRKRHVTSRRVGSHRVAYTSWQGSLVHGCLNSVPRPRVGGIGCIRLPVTYLSTGLPVYVPFFSLPVLFDLTYLPIITIILPSSRRIDLQLVFHVLCPDRKSFFLRFRLEIYLTKKFISLSHSLDLSRVSLLPRTSEPIYLYTIRLTKLRAVPALIIQYQVHSR